MDGWESRRKRTPGHDWCIIKLATSGKIHGVDIDTNFFLGNHPPFASIEACNRPDYPSANELNSDKNLWIEILPKLHLDPGSQHFFEIHNRQIFTHLRLNIFFLKVLFNQHKRLFVNVRIFIISKDLFKNLIKLFFRKYLRRILLFLFLDFFSLAFLKKS
jgi:hypothetical protein